MEMSPFFQKKKQCKVYNFDYTIEGINFEFGSNLSNEVHSSIEILTQMILAQTSKSVEDNS